MTGSLRRLVAFAAAVALSPSVASAVQLVLRPDRAVYAVGQTAHVSLYAVSDGSDVQVSGVQAVLSWTPADIASVGVDLSGAPGFALGGFAPDPYGINELELPQDGQAVFVGLVAVDQNVTTTSAGTLLGTIDFQVLNSFETSVIVLDLPAGQPQISSAVFGAASPNTSLPLTAGRVEISATICLGDLDLSGTIDLVDLTILLANYGSGTMLEQGDLDGDQDVDLSDLAALLALYGSDCGA